MGAGVLGTGDRLRFHRRLPGDDPKPVSRLNAGFLCRENQLRDLHLPPGYVLDVLGDVVLLGHDRDAPWRIDTDNRANIVSPAGRDPVVVSDRTADPWTEEVF